VFGYNILRLQKSGGQGPAPGSDNLLVSTVSRHSLDRLNMSSDLPPKPYEYGEEEEKEGQQK